MLHAGAGTPCFVGAGDARLIAGAGEVYSTIGAEAANTAEAGLAKLSAGAGRAPPLELVRPSHCRRWRNVVHDGSWRGLTHGWCLGDVLHQGS